MNEEEKHEEEFAKARDEHRRQPEQSVPPPASSGPAQISPSWVNDEKLRWKLALLIIAAFISVEVFGYAAVNMKQWWQDHGWHF